jgi:hypothetical protein
VIYLRKKITNQSGIALITVLMLTSLLVLMTVSMIFISSNSLSLVGNIESGGKAMKSAEAGVEYAINKLNSDPNWGLSSLVFNTDNSCTFTADSSININELFAPDCNFKITFDTTAPNHSVNNLFEKDEAAALSRGTPPFTAKIISVGEAGPPGGREKRILEVYLVRSDYSPYTLTANGMLFMEYASVFNIFGKQMTDPGFINSNWADTDPNDSITFTGVDSWSDCPLGLKYVVSTNKGTMTAMKNIDVDPNGFDGIKIQNVSRKAPQSVMEVDKIVNRLKNQGIGDGTMVEVGGGKVTLRETPLNLASITSAGDYYSTVSIDSTASDFTSAAHVTQVDSSGKTTLVLDKDIYVNGGAPVATEKDWSYKDLIAHGNTNLLQMDVAPESVYMEWCHAEVDSSGTLVKTVKSIPRDISMNLGDKSIASESHLILGLDVEAGDSGKSKIVSNGKIAYAEGVSHQSSNFATVSGDDITIEISERSSGSYGNGLCYAMGNVVIEPTEPNSPLNINNSLPEGTYPLQKHGSGKLVSDSSSETSSGMLITVGSANQDKGATVYKTQIDDGTGTGTMKNDVLLVDGRDLKTGEPDNLLINYTQKQPGDAIDTRDLPPGYTEPSDSCICCHITDASSSSSLTENRRKRENVDLDFGQYMIAIPADPTGGWFDTANVTLYDRTTGKPVPDLDAVLASLDLNKTELEALADAFYSTSWNTNQKDIRTNIAIVSLNKKDNPSNKKTSIVAGDNWTPGKIRLGTYDYMKDIIFMEGTNFKVRKVSYREIK